MQGNNVHFSWRDAEILRGFRTGVCLHGHTMYSQECLSFLPRYLRRVPGVGHLVRHYERPRAPGERVDFARAWWTPPLSPASALSLERTQIAGLGLHPLVSLTDHDDIEAPMALQVTAGRSDVPVSVEWTVPYERSIFHLGVHNLPSGLERSLMTAFAAYTSEPREARLPDLLEECAKIPDVLIVLNHPYWLEEGVAESDHAPALARLLRQCREWIHAFELNGTRVWKENAAVISLAQGHSMPLVSGGDRHACEPAACINLTNTQTFSGFVSEVRQGSSSLLFLPHYREPMALRILEAARDILRPHPEYPGRTFWTDRIFYRGDDGSARPLSLIWKDRVPWMLNGAAWTLQSFTTTRFRPALRLLLAERGEARL